jgi:ABC-type Mn2+/Zn2+ transport system permease subunit
VIEYLFSDFLFRNAILGGWIVCVLCAVLGVYVVLRRLVLLGVALPQAGAAGIAWVFFATGHAHGDLAEAHALALGGSLAATFAALGVLVLGGRRSSQPVEWRIGGILAIAMAATLLFVALSPTGDMEMTSLLRGELLVISDRDLALLTGVALSIAVPFALFRRELLLVSFDPEFARTIGRDPMRWDLVLYLLLGAAISIGVMTAGPLVVFAFLVLPALTALRLGRSMRTTFAVAAAIATLSSLGGFALSYHADLPAGPVYVMIAAGIWLAVSVALRALRVAARRAL